MTDNRRFMAAVAVFFLCGLVVAVAAGMAMQKARQADRRSVSTAQQLLVESQDNLVRAQVEACDSRNKSREDTRALFAHLGQLAERNRPPGTPPSPTAEAFFAYLEEAYDPIPCVWGHPSFGIDPDPPPTLPPLGGSQ